MDKALAVALVKVQAELDNPISNRKGQVGSRSYNYADLGAYLDSVRAVFAKHGLAIVQQCMPTDGSFITVKSMLIHESGESLSDEGLSIKPDKPGPQGLGAALTYARRYGMAALCGLATEDSDGVSDPDGAQGGRRQEPLRKSTQSPTQSATQSPTQSATQKPNPQTTTSRKREDAFKRVRALYAEMSQLGGNPGTYVGPETKDWPIEKIEDAERSMQMELDYLKQEAKPSATAVQMEASLDKIREELDDSITQTAAELVRLGGDVDAVLKGVDLDNAPIPKLQKLHGQLRAAVLRQMSAQAKGASHGKMETGTL